MEHKHATRVADRFFSEDGTRRMQRAPAWRTASLVHLVLLSASGICFLLAGATTGSAQTQAEGNPPDPRLEYFELEPLYARYAQASCLMVVKGRALTARGDGDYDLATGPFNTIKVEGTEHPLSPDNEFFGQPVVRSPDGWNFAASAVLVGERHVLGAHHTWDNAASRGIGCEDWAFVFDFRLDARFGGGLTGSAPVIPAEDVYHCVQVSNVDPHDDRDWIVVELDRDVETDRQPLKVRRLGMVDDGATVAVVGHPERMPVKVGIGEAYFVGGLSDVIYSHIPVSRGSSGSMLLGEESGMVEGVVVSGMTPAAPASESGDSWDWCFGEDCDDDPWVSALSVAHALNAVPRAGLQVSPEVPFIDHFGPPGGPFTNGDTVDHELWVPIDSRPVSYTNFDWRDAPGGMPPKGIPLDPGETHGYSRPLAEYVDVLEVGHHEVAQTFSDLTFGSFEQRVHRVWVGEDGFSVMPEDDFPTSGPGALPHESQVYTILNRYLDEQVVEVTVSEDWILLNGRQGTTELVVPGLSDASSNSRDVTVSFDASRLHEQGQYTGTIEFRTTYASQTLHTEVREVTLDFGREVYVGQPGQFTSPGTDLVEIGRVDVYNLMAPSIVDLDVELDITIRNWRPGTGTGTIYLESPSGSRVGLYRPSPYSDQIDLHVAAIYDDTSNRPSGPGSLADLVGQGVVVTWKILTDIEGTVSVDAVALRAWF